MCVDNSRCNYRRCLRLLYLLEVIVQHAIDASQICLRLQSSSSRTETEHEQECEVAGKQMQLSRALHRRTGLRIYRKKSVVKNEGEREEELREGPEGEEGHCRLELGALEKSSPECGLSELQGAPQDNARDRNERGDRHEQERAEEEGIWQTMSREFVNAVCTGCRLEQVEERVDAPHRQITLCAAEGQLYSIIRQACDVPS